MEPPFRLPMHGQIHISAAGDKNWEIVSFTLVDIHAPAQLKDKFWDLPPIFKSCEVSRECVGEHMWAFCEHIGSLVCLWYMVFSSYFGVKTLVPTPLLHLYLPRILPKSLLVKVQSCWYGKTYENKTCFSAYHFIKEPAVHKALCSHQFCSLETTPTPTHRRHPLSQSSTRRRPQEHHVGCLPQHRWLWRSWNHKWRDRLWAWAGAAENTTQSKLPSSCVHMPNYGCCRSGMIWWRVTLTSFTGPLCTLILISITLCQRVMHCTIAYMKRQATGLDA